MQYDDWSEAELEEAAASASNNKAGGAGGAAPAKKGLLASFMSSIAKMSPNPKDQRPVLHA